MMRIKTVFLIFPSCKKKIDIVASRPITAVAPTNLGRVLPRLVVSQDPNGDLRGILQLPFFLC